MYVLLADLGDLDFGDAHIHFNNVNVCRYHLEGIGSIGLRQFTNSFDLLIRTCRSSDIQGRSYNLGIARRSRISY